MKKILALLLAMVMLLGILAGCGKKQTTNNNTEPIKNAANQQANKDDVEVDIENLPPDQLFGVAAGTELTVPEKVFDASTLDMLYISFIRVVDGKQVNTEIAVGKSPDGDELIYVVNGPGEAENVIYETREDGIFKYVKGSGNNPYKHDEDTTDDAVAVEKETIKSYVSIFTQYLDIFPGIKFRKTLDISVNCPTGDVYIYDVISNDKVVGQICVDRETGMLVKIKDLSDGKANEQFVISSETGILTKEDKDTAAGALLSMVSYKTADVQLPAYEKYIPSSKP